MLLILVLFDLDLKVETKEEIKAVVEEALRFIPR